MKTVHASEYAVQMKHCCKSFGRVVANDNVDLRLKWGEIHALLGENGSGKTTLVNMLSGIHSRRASAFTLRFSVWLRLKLFWKLLALLVRNVSLLLTDMLDDLRSL